MDSQQMQRDGGGGGGGGLQAARTEVTRRNCAAELPGDSRRGRRCIAVEHMPRPLPAWVVHLSSSRSAGSTVGTGMLRTTEGYGCTNN